MTTNKPMPGEQLDELMTIAVKMQRDSEKANDRSAAIFAYTVQIAVLEIRETRCKYEELQSQNADMAVQLANAESKCRELAAVVAENAALKNPDNWLSQSDYGYEASEVATQNGATEDESLRAGMVAIINRIEAPATDAFMAEVRASAIPEGYVLVPQEMHLSSEAMEGICFHCGDGGFAFGEFTDGLLFFGAIDDSDGQKIHGLHIATADYPEEGCATICEFLPGPHRGAAQ